MTNDFRFPKSRRILKRAEFDRVFQQKRSTGDGVLLVYGAANDLSMSRLGLVVSRKCGNAVARARWKRCIREAFRLAQHDLPTGADWIVLPRAGGTPTMPRVKQSLLALASRLAPKLK